MAAPERRHTLLGTALPPGPLSPTLLFHKWHRYDCFVPDHYLNDRGKRVNLTPFSQEVTGSHFLREVAASVQVAGQEHYEGWHRRFDAGCGGVEGVHTDTVYTEWRTVVGWATNPAFETGITLDPLYGFPFIPGAAVKGLLHRVAEQALLKIVPVPPVRGTEAPPSELGKAVTWALRVRALFGSLHLRPDNDEQPTSALVLLERWRGMARRAVRESAHAEAWSPLLPRLETVCSEAPTGGMVTCFDAVPQADSFAPRSEPMLQVDVLTPHVSGSPVPILFLAVRSGIGFELRVRLVWPADKPRDDEESQRCEAVAGLDRNDVLNDLRTWLLRGLAELGIGGKTSAGYGYLYGARRLPQLPRPLPEPDDEKTEEPTLPPAEAEARKRLPDDIDDNRATSILDAVLDEPASETRTAVVRRFQQLFPSKLESWESKIKAATKKRVRLMREALSEEWP